MAAISALVVVEVGLVDLRTDTAADFVADLASDYSANKGADERAKSAAHRACNHACWRRLKIEPPCRLNFEPRQMAIRSLRGRKTSSIPKTGPPHHVLADERVLMAGYRA